MIRVLWRCDDCAKPVSLTVPTTGLRVHVDQPIRVHQAQHRG